MNKKIAYYTTIAVLWFGIASSFGQTVSDEAKRHFDRGMAAVEMAKTAEDYGPAIKEFEQAASLAPDWPDVYYNLGMVQEKAEKYSDAVTNLKQYLRLAPEASDAETVKSFINKMEYKKDQEEGVKKVYDMMTSDSYEAKQVGDRKKSDGVYLSAEAWLNAEALGELRKKFRMVSGELQARNGWYSYPAYYAYHPKQHPPIPREWEPVKVNGRFYEYTFSYYMDVSTSYVVRYDYEVKGEIISIDPPRVKDIVKYSVTWGAPIEGNKRPWSDNDNFEGVSEYISELIAKDKTPIAKGADVNAKYESGYTPLRFAVMGGQKEKVELLIAKGADVNGKYESGLTPLRIAVMKGQKEMVELLIAKGADVNAKNENGATPLHTAAQVGQKEVAELLIAKGADVNAKDQFGLTPLHTAVIGDQKEMVELLIAKGADVNAKDKNGDTPLRYAEIKHHKDMAEPLKKHGAR